MATALLPDFSISGSDPQLPPSIRSCMLSLDAGVQSTTLTPMTAYGEIGSMPDYAIFADTDWEPEWFDCGS